MTTISGRAYGSRATLEHAGEALTWRALRGTARENIATTTHDVRASRLAIGRLSIAGVVLAVIGGGWFATESVVQGAVMLAAAAVVLALRAALPTRRLHLELADRILVLEIDAASLTDVRVLVAQIARDRPAHESSKPIALP